MKRMIERWAWKLRALRTHSKMLNRRVDVENVLISVANGKRDLLTREECRELAQKLGVVS